MHVRPLRQPTERLGNQPATSARPARTAGCSSLPIIGPRLPASSSFVLARACRRGAAGAPAWTPAARRHQPAATRKATTTVPPKPGDRRPRPRVNSARPLDSWGPYGCPYGCRFTWSLPASASSVFAGPRAGPGRGAARSKSRRMIHPYGATLVADATPLRRAGHHHLSHPAPPHPHPALDLPESPRNDRTAPVPAACSLPAAGGERPRARCRRTKHAISAPTTQKGTCAAPAQAVLTDFKPTVHVPPSARSPRTTSLIHRSIFRCGSDGNLAASRSATDRHVRRAAHNATTQCDRRRHCAAPVGGGHLPARPRGDRWFCPTVGICLPGSSRPPRTP